MPSSCCRLMNLKIDETLPIGASPPWDSKNWVTCWMASAARGGGESGGSIIGGGNTDGGATPGGATPCVEGGASSHGSRPASSPTSCTGAPAGLNMAPTVCLALRPSTRPGGPLRVTSKRFLSTCRISKCSSSCLRLMPGTDFTTCMNGIVCFGAAASNSLTAEICSWVSGGRGVSTGTALPWKIISAPCDSMPGKRTSHWPWTPTWLSSKCVSSCALFKPLKFCVRRPSGSAPPCCSRYRAMASTCVASRAATSDAAAASGVAFCIAPSGAEPAAATSAAAAATRAAASEACGCAACNGNVAMRSPSSRSPTCHWSPTRAKEKLPSSCDFFTPRKS
mmetsp:Transcript_45391/g.140245  ORF Transcript_45391/g.140245 Transcript_45391/m.140245 type:complete len:337 (+) Transcript_45391:595-1605(+)